MGYHSRAAGCGVDEWWERVTKELRVPEGTYLPGDDSSLKGKWFRLWLRLAYRVWRRELARFFARSPAGRGQPRLLDFGCGPGLLLRFCGEWFPGIRRVGVDLDSAVLRYAVRRAQGASFVRASASRQDLPVASGSFDVVTALHIVEHLEYPDRFLRDARRVLKAGGLLMLATPNPVGLGARIAGRRWGGLRGDHISLRRPDEWRVAVERAGFRVRREGTTGLSGVPLLRRMPLAFLHWVPLLVFGFFPWRQGEAYICLADAA